MILFFKVGNYRCINEPITINFNSSAISEHKETNTIRIKGHSVLRSILIYGHNASGKSKLIEALIFMRWFAINSATESQAGGPINVEAFRLNPDTETAPSLFEIGFQIDRQKYRYGFEADSRQVHNEWLFEIGATVDHLLFVRKKEEFEINETKFSNAENLEKRTRKNALFLSVASQWNVQKAEKIISWFQKINTIHGVHNEMFRSSTLELMQNEKEREQVIKFIQEADLGIDNMKASPRKFYKREIRDIPSETQHFLVNEEFPEIYTYHSKFDDKGSLVGVAQFSMEIEESEGTRKFFNLIGVFLKAIKENRLIIVDELDASLHSVLTKAILKLLNSNKTGSSAQLLATSHDTALLDRDLLRRDQIYFIEKNQFGASQLTSLVEYQVRKEAPFDKNYLEGRYGAIPFISEFENILIHAKS